MVSAGSYIPMKFLKTKFKRARPLLGTYAQIELEGEWGANILNKYITAGFEAIAKIDRLMSYHCEDSDLTRLNRAKEGAWIKISPLTLKVLKISNDLFQISQGVFDIRCGKFLANWNILPGRVQNCVDQNRIFSKTPPLEFNQDRARKTGPWIFDLGGIAKGYAVDYAVKKIRHLSKRNKISGIVNAGGDLYMWGKSGTPTAVKIYAKPFAWLRKFKLSDGALATSSVRTRTNFSQNINVSDHVKMPLGEPYTGEKTVAVFAANCLFADALTKIVLLGSEDTARRCLSAYKAYALIFKSNGHLQKAMN